VAGPVRGADRTDVVRGPDGEHFARLFEILASPVGQRLVVFEACLLLAALVIWLRDGRPGLGRPVARSDAE